MNLSLHKIQSCFDAFMYCCVHYVIYIWAWADHLNMRKTPKHLTLYHYRRTVWLLHTIDDLCKLAWAEKLTTLVFAGFSKIDQPVFRPFIDRAFYVWIQFSLNFGRVGEWTSQWCIVSTQSWKAIKIIWHIVHIDKLI